MSEPIQYEVGTIRWSVYHRPDGYTTLSWSVLGGENHASLTLKTEEVWELAETIRRPPWWFRLRGTRRVYRH